jgi:hypothetical protein
MNRNKKKKKKKKKKTVTEWLVNLYDHDPLVQSNI